MNRTRLRGILLAAMLLSADRENGVRVPYLRTSAVRAAGGVV